MKLEKNGDVFEKEVALPATADKIYYKVKSPKLSIRLLSLVSSIYESSVRKSHRSSSPASLSLSLSETANPEPLVWISTIMHCIAVWDSMPG